MTRFSEFERSLGIAPNVLANRLEGFVAEGLMEIERAVSRRAHEYVLTDKGRELGVVVMALTQWGDRWAAPDGPPILLQHHECGGAVQVKTSCDRCGQEPGVDEVVAVPGPGADDEVRRKRSR